MVLSYQLCALMLASGYAAYVAISQLFFSRISHIPGPKLAAISHLYQFYYDVYPHQGRFLWQCKKLHEMYGPVIRIGPDEVHIHDPDFYQQMYTSNSRRRDKSPSYFWMAKIPEFGGGSVFSTLDHSHHRLRRQALSPAFSKRRIQGLESEIKQNCVRLKEVVLGYAGKKELLNIHQTFGALTLDVIAAYCYGSSFEALESPDLGHDILQMFHDGSRVFPFARQFPWVMHALVRTPNWVKSRIDSFRVQADFESLVYTRVRAAYEDATKHRAESTLDSDKTVIHMIIENGELPDEEKTFQRIFGESSVLVGAGLETTARALAVIFFYVLLDISIHNLLLEELNSVMPRPHSQASMALLEKLPYLTAVINEGLRIAHGQAGRLARISPTEDLICQGIRIPAGVDMGQSSYLIHSDPKIWQDPFEFRPERFLETDLKGSLKYFTPFSKGARSCVGMNLAMAELYLTVATLLRSVRMELVDTTKYDVTTVKEYVVGFFPDDSKGIRVRVLGPHAT